MIVNQKRVMPLLLITVFMVAPGLASKVLKEGAELGKWSMDLDAAIELAKKNQFPLFLDFTGSDWCGWCKVMKKKIFSTKEWRQFAESNLSLITIDFPQDQSIVPKRFWKRNQDLQTKYRVMGFPTYIILDSEGKKELARFGAGPNQDVHQFIKTVRQVLKQSKASLNKFIKELSPKIAEEYKSLIKKREETQNGLDQWLRSRPEQTQENLENFLNFHSKLTNLTIEIQKIEAEKIAKELSPERAKSYRTLVSKLNRTRRELNEWLCSRPESTAVNMNKQATLERQIHELSKLVTEYQ